MEFVPTASGKEWDTSVLHGFRPVTINGAVTSTVIYGRYDVNWILGYILLSIVCAVLSALYPAWKVQKLTPVDAMRA